MNSTDRISWDVEWATYLRGPGTGGTWRQRLAGWLRLRADRLDGCHSYAVHVVSSPTLTSRELNSAVRAGMAHAHELITAEARMRALDAELVRMRPYLAGAPAEPARRIAP
jgi:hypothetical protein